MDNNEAPDLSRAEFGGEIPRVAKQFDREFRQIERKFPDFGQLELHQDEAAGRDAGAGASRQFAYCTTQRPFIIAFASKAERLPDSYIRGLIRHEMGHALDYRYGKRELERRLNTNLPRGVEKRADAIASAVWEAPIEYGDNDVQCIGCGGKTERPKHLHQNPGSSSDVVAWEIVCPDGGVRHMPYTNEEDAAFDADLCTEEGCQLYPDTLGGCPGGEHFVREDV